MFPQQLKLVSFVAVAAIALALSGCGGGGTGGGGIGGGGTDLSLLDKWKRFADGEPTLKLSLDEMIDLHNKVEEKKTHGVAGTFYEATPRGWINRSQPGGHTYMIDSDSPDILSGSSLSEGFLIRSVLEHNGVKLVNQKFHGSYEDEYEGLIMSSMDNFLGYLEYSGFLVQKSLDCAGSSLASCSEDSLGEMSSLTIRSDSGGQYLSENPTGMGSATWTGVMTGLDVTQFEPGITRWMLGDARIEIDDLSNPDVDVSFTGIRDVNAGTSRPDMVWDDLSLTDGAFNDGSSRTISGLFYGPTQQEVGGVFDRDGITGAFGATR